MDLIIPNWHPTLVHFTIALLTVAAVFFIGAVFISDKTTDWRTVNEQACFF